MRKTPTLTAGEAGPVTKSQPRFFYGYTIAGISLIVLLLTYGSYFSFGVFFAPLVKQFEWSRADTAGAFALGTLVSGVVAIGAGHLVDRYGPRLLTTVCGVLLGAGYLLMGTTAEIWQLYIFYGALVGMGIGIPYVVVLPTASRWFVKRRGLVNGVVITGIGFGATLMPLLASWVIANFDWRTSYLVVGAVVLVMVVLLGQFLKKEPKVMGLAPYGEGQEKATQGRGAAWLETLSMAQIMRTPQFYLVCTMFFCEGYVLLVGMVHAVPHAIDVGVSPSNAAWVLSIIGAASIVGNIVMGVVTDRIGGRYPFAISFALFAVSIIWLPFAKDFWEFVLFASVFGFAYGANTAPQASLLIEYFGIKLLGLMLGTVAFIYTISSSVGPYLSGLLFDTNQNYLAAFLISGGFALAGLVATLVLRPIKTKSSNPS
jgi:MFS family permease